jgi:hypothetical protein
MTRLLSIPRTKRKIGRARVLTAIGVVVYTVTLWVLALWTSTHAEESVALVSTTGSTVIAIVSPRMITGLMIAGVLGLLVGMQVLIDRLAPLPAPPSVRSTVYVTPPLRPRHTSVAPAGSMAEPTGTHLHVVDQPAAPSATHVAQEAYPSVYADGTVFEVAHAGSGKLIWTYSREGSALGFVRDVVRVRSHADAAQFELRIVHGGVRGYTVAQGEQLVRRALEDRVL